MKTTVAKAIITCLEQEGIEYAFGISGSHYIAFFNALKDSKITFISVKHESAAGFMALNYTKIAQKPALLCATAGPGAMNILNGVSELYKSELPAVIITPLIASRNFGKIGIQEDTGWGNTHSIVDIMKNITRKSHLVHSPHVAVQLLLDLFRFGFSDQYGPVHMAVPSDYFEAEIEFEPLKPEEYRFTDNRKIEVQKIDQLAKKILHAERPVLLAGKRCLYPDCSKEIEEISDNFHLPVITTYKSKGIFDETKPLFAGVLDLFGHKSAEKIIKESDFVISCGVDFDEQTSIRFDPDILKHAYHASIDSNVLEIGRNYRVDHAVSGNIKETLACLSQQLKKYSYKSRIDQSEFQKKVHEINEYFYKEQEDRSVPLKPQTVLYELSKTIPDGSAVFCDIGSIVFWTMRNFPVHNFHYYISFSGASMGQGVSGCIGGKLAQPDAPVFCLCGDGGFLMNGMEAATAQQYHLGIVWIIFIDSKYNMVDQAQKMIYGNLDFCTDIFIPDFSKFADAFSLHYFSITTIDDISPAVEKAAGLSRENESSLITLEYDKDEILPIKPNTVRCIQDIMNVSQLKPTKHMMKVLKNTIREKL